MSKFILINLFVLLFYSSAVFSQTTDEAKKSYLNAKIKYTSNSVWLGRSDSIVTPVFGVSAGYHFNFGAYLNAEMSIIPSRQIDILDLTTVQTGYGFSIIKDVFDADISYTHNFYSQYSTQVGSEVMGTAAADLSYDFDLVQLSVNGEFSFGSSSDIGLSSALSKSIDIEFKKGSLLNITPTATAYAGTQNLYAVYLVTRSQKAVHGKNSHAANASSKNPHASANSAATTTTTTTVTKEYARFNMLDVDISLPISYTYKKFTFAITPVMAIPLNVQSGEFTSNPFFIRFSVGVKI